MHRELRAASCPGLPAPSAPGSGSRARHRRCWASHGPAAAGVGGRAEPQSWL